MNSSGEFEWSVLWSVDFQVGVVRVSLSAASVSEITIRDSSPAGRSQAIEAWQEEMNRLVTARLAD